MLFAVVGLGGIEVLGFALFAISVYAAFSSLTTKLVIQKLVDHEQASAEAPPVIELVGRQQGIISFLLTLIGISPITDFKVTPDEVCCNSNSLFGRRNQAVPLRAISSVAAGVRKPIGYLLMAFCFSFAGVFGGLVVLWQEGLTNFLVTLLVCGALAALFVWLYAINKTFFVSIYNQGGPPLLLAFKPNVIEGVKLDLDRALRVVKIIRDRVIASTTPTPMAVSHAMTPASPNGQQGVHPIPEESDPSPFEATTHDFDDYLQTPLGESAETLLQSAREFIKQNKRQEAVGVLREIILRFPTSSEAGIAKSTLERAGVRA